MRGARCAREPRAGIAAELSSPRAGPIFASVSSSAGAGAAPGTRPQRRKAWRASMRDGDQHARGRCPEQRIVDAHAASRPSRSFPPPTLHRLLRSMRVALGARFDLHRAVRRSAIRGCGRGLSGIVKTRRRGGETASLPSAGFLQRSVESEREHCRSGLILRVTATPATAERLGHGGVLDQLLVKNGCTAAPTAEVAAFGAPPRGQARGFGARSPVRVEVLPATQNPHAMLMTAMLRVPGGVLSGLALRRGAPRSRATS
jgi:hypothetical protein